MSAEELVVEYRDPRSLAVDENNARLHSAEQVEQIKASIVEFGPTNPILLDEDGKIIAGHGRQRAAIDLDLPSFPTITLRGLSITQKRAYAVADNRLAENATWDAEKLGVELDALRDAGVDGKLLGFSAEELNDLIGTDRTGPPLFPRKGENRASDHWNGMPEFEQADKTAFRSLPVHFKDQAAVDAFAEKLGQKITEKTRSLWFPQIEIETTAEKRYADEDPT